MTGNGRCFVEWKEQFVSQERGNRVVHYFLKDSGGESVLAVVGTERSVRHMFYVVAEEFVQAYGADNAIHAGFKWRSRREVVDWLTSMLSKQHLHGGWSKSPKHISAHAIGSPKYPVNGFSSQQMQGRVSRNWNGLNSEIVWSGNAWRCGKQLKHYSAFCRNATTIAVQSFVFVMAKGQNHYVAYLEDMYEDKRGLKKVKVRWFHHNQEVKGVVPLRNAHPKEVFITPYSQVISAECVDGPATVLTREHYEECLAAFPNALASRVHLCFRQFRSNKVKPFDLTKLGGYYNQPILASLNAKSFPGADSAGFGFYGEEDEEFSPSDTVKVGVKRSRSNRGCETFVTDDSIAGNTNNQMMTFEHSYIKSRYGLSGKRLLPLKHVECQQGYSSTFKVDEKIEFLCQDSGLRGCWFRCTIVQVSRKQIKVQYDDVQDEDEYGNLEEWISAFKLAVPDKLGMRCPGRPTVRPVLPSNDQELAAEVGLAVDAWWSDGWWEGIVTKINDSNDILQVYFPGEDNFLDINKENLRISRDWVGDKWIDIQVKPGILSTISATVGADTKVSMASIMAKDVHPSDVVASSGSEVPSSSEPHRMEEISGSDVPTSSEPHTEIKPDLALLNTSDSRPEEIEVDYCSKPLSSGNKANTDDDGNISVCQDKVDEVQGDNDNDNEDDPDDDDNSDKLDSESLEASEKNCKAIELMEVTA